LCAALQERPNVRQACEQYAAKGEFRNFDHLLEYLVESPFAALVIIDSMPENLEVVLSKRFQFGVEVLARYESETGERAYHFEPFLEDVVGETVTRDRVALVTLNTDEIDTVFVPAKEDGFQEVFLGEDRWHAVRIHGSVRPQTKYIAAYQVSPVQAITHFAPVKSIEPWKDAGKFVLTFSERAKTIGPIPLVKHGSVKAPQSPRYTTHARLLKAKSLDKLFAEPSANADTASSS
jgi:hypothetical protein